MEFSRVENLSDLKNETEELTELSALVERVAQDLHLLSLVAKNNDRLLTCSTLDTLLQALRQAYERIGVYKNNFAYACGTTGDQLVDVLGRVYASAHLAAVMEAYLFVDKLWSYLDPNGKRKLWDELVSGFEESDDDKVKEELTRKILLYPMSMESILVTEKWDQAQTLILSFLPDTWFEEFRAVQPRIQRERAILESKSVIQEHPYHPAREEESIGENCLPVLVPLQASILKALDRRALKMKELADEVCDGESSRLYKNNGIKELREYGLVAHQHGLGFYRPDKPPKQT